MDGNRRQSGGEAAGRGGGERVFWGALAALALCRALAALAPGMWLWGANHLRFLPAWAWLLWLASAAALLPPVGRRLAPGLAALGNRLERGWAWPALLAAAAGLFVLALPDRTYFAGDALLRSDAAREGVFAGHLSPQALPLDVWLHSLLPAWALAALGLPPAWAIRLLGAAEAALLSRLATAFARRLALRGAALAAVAGLVWWGGWLALFTGFAKAFSEMVVVVAAVAVFGIDAQRGRRLWPLALAGSAALLLHRSALGLLPALAWALWAGVTAAHPRGRAARLEAWGAVALVVVALAAAAPQLVASVRVFDTRHFAAAGEGGVAVLAAAFAPLRLLDLANLLLFLVPLAPLLALRGRNAGRAVPGPARAGPYLLALALPFAAALFFLRPAQGIPRDFDDYAAGALAVGLLVAWRAGGMLRAAPRAAWLAAAVIAGAAMPVTQWLALQNDPSRALTRAEALASGPPPRSANERAQLWDFIGGRRFRAGEYEPAARDLARAAALAPSPRLLLGWAEASGRAGDWAAAERAYGQLVERAPADDAPLRALAWYGLAGAALQGRDDLAAGRARLEQALALRPDYPEARRLLAQVEAETRRRADAQGAPSR